MGSFVHCIADGNKNSGAARMEDIMAVPQKVKNRVTL